MTGMQHVGRKFLFLLAIFVSGCTRPSTFWLQSDSTGQRLFYRDEQVMVLPSSENPNFSEVRLRPGQSPQLQWYANWDIANQGAFAEGKTVLKDIRVRQEEGATHVEWEAEQVDGRFLIRSQMLVGFDQNRRTYTYDIDSSLVVQGTTSFDFVYGYIFEHNWVKYNWEDWEYFLAQSEDGTLIRWPLVKEETRWQYNLKQDGGLRLFYGRKSGEMRVVPAIEYSITPQLNVDANGNPIQRDTYMGICAAFFDTGLGFKREVAQPGTTVRVKYRYLGYTPEEAAILFEKSVAPE